MRTEGDVAMSITQRTQSGVTADYLTAMTERDNLCASVGFEAKRRNMTLGVNLNGQFSSGQRDLGMRASARWEM